MASVMWFRRDLRLADNPALLAACAAGETVPLFVLDPRLWGPAGDPRKTWLVRSLRALDESLDGSLLVRHGPPTEIVPQVAAAAGAQEVHVAADFGPYGRERDARVEAALSATGVRLVRTGSPYAVAPGRVRKPDGTPYRVFTPYARAWRAHGWRRPVQPPGAVAWIRPLPDHGIPAEPDLDGIQLPPAGEAAALETWQRFRAARVSSYREDRNRPDLAGTSSLSGHLKYGEIHPRTLLAGLGDDSGSAAFRGELAWREFYAEQLWHWPESAREHLRPEFTRMRHDRPDERFLAWTEGRTGFPFVDAGMRQLRAEGWMHNRARMTVASFLVKDLHVAWQHGARHFLRWLRDGDLASNSSSWQWVAGTGSDAAPYHRVFNPVLQGRKFDPSGDYVRRYVEELRGVAGAAVHEPWLLLDGVPAGYPARVVEHDAERVEALARYQEVRREGAA